MNYSESNYSLHYSSDFKKIEVLDSNGDLEATYDLTTSQSAVQIGFASGVYSVNTVDRPSSTTVSIDAARDPDLSFNSSITGGIVVIDLRDMGRAGDPQVGTYEVAFDLEEESVKIWYESGPWALRFNFSDATTFSYQ